MENELNDDKRPLNCGYLKYLLVFAISVIILCLLAALIVIAKLRIGNLFLGLIFFTLAIIGIILAGIYLKKFRLETEKENYSFGRDITLLTHENDIDDICDSKYTSKSCGKLDMIKAWDKNDAQQILNPECYSKAARWYYFKYFKFFVFICFALVFAFISSIGAL